MCERYWVDHSEWHHHDSLSYEGRYRAAKNRKRIMLLLSERIVGLIVLFLLWIMTQLERMGRKSSRPETTFHPLPLTVEIKIKSNIKKRIIPFNVFEYNKTQLPDISPTSGHHRDQVMFVISSTMKKHMISFNVFEYEKFNYLIFHPLPLTIEIKLRL